ncbi:unnamed protein product [Protopolystoma xenopodis]|uniref:Uncharacterized protein n=1 Tax=Protopolystoma xenopodis TaxID=117903 RepID=A0A3S5CJ78_9PLAT|nr:unnamed protein product [Protopolystoma xenopodis]
MLNQYYKIKKKSESVHEDSRRKNRELLERHNADLRLFDSESTRLGINTDALLGANTVSELIPPGASHLNNLARHFSAMQSVVIDTSSTSSSCGSTGRAAPTASGETNSSGRLVFANRNSMIVLNAGNTAHMSGHHVSMSESDSPGQNQR